MEFKSFIEEEFFASLLKGLKWIPLNKLDIKEFWQNDGDLLDRWKIESPKELHKAILQIPLEDSIGLRGFKKETLELYNSFDIWLKERYKVQVVDFIDYSKGTIYLIKPITSIL